MRRSMAWQTAARHDNDRDMISLRCRGLDHPTLFIVHAVYVCVVVAGVLRELDDERPLSTALGRVRRHVLTIGWLSPLPVTYRNQNPI